MRHLRFLDRLDGSPFALPAALDAWSERWWAMPPRARGLLLAFLVVLALVAGTSHVAATPYGPPTTALVAVSDLAVGHDLDRSDVRQVDWPEDLVPEAAAHEASGRLAAALPTGSVLTDHHLTDGGAASQLATGMAAVPLPADLLPTLAPGHVVDVIGADVTGDPSVLAHEAQVISTDGVDVWLAVPRDRAPSVAAAGASGTITVVVLPG